MDDPIFFDDNGPISPEEAFRRFQKMAERDTELAIASMGKEYYEELDQFLEDYTITHSKEINVCLSTIMVSMAAGSVADIINTILSTLVVGAMGYREYLLKINPVLADQINGDIHKEADAIREATGKEHGPDEEAN